MLIYKGLDNYYEYQIPRVQLYDMNTHDIDRC
jgi:hypothetical protein